MYKVCLLYYFIEGSFTVDLKMPFVAISLSISEISKWFVSNTNEFSVFNVLKLTQWLADCPLVYCFSII